MKIAIASGKGGTGKTLVSVNLFNVIQKSGQEVVLADCDAEEPNADQFIKGKITCSREVERMVPVIDPQKCTFCGKCAEYCNYHAIVIIPEKHYVSVIEELCHNCGACSYACPVGAITEKGKKIGTFTESQITDHSNLVSSCMDIGVYSCVPLIKETIKSAEGSPVILIDSPPGASCPFIAAVETADFVVLVTEPTPFGLSDLKMAVDTLKTMGKSCGAVINRAGLGDDSVKEYLKENNIPLLSEIPFDRNIAKEYSEGRLITDTIPEYEENFRQLFLNIKRNIG